VLVARARNELKISPDLVFATADWFTNCPLLTVAENAAHEKAMERALRRADAARGGRSLDALHERKVDKSIEAQKPSGAVSGSSFDF